MLNLKTLVSQIHATPYKAVLAITGGGAEAIGELLRYGGGSNTLLEAIVPYDQKSFDDFLKGTPDKYCSPGAARDLAMAAYQRANRLAPDNLAHNIGIGVSCSLAKDNERAGREHKAYIAVQTPTATATYILDHQRLSGVGEHENPNAVGRTREEEEAIVANEILHVLANASAVILYPTFYQTVAPPEQFQVTHGEVPTVTFDPFNKVYVKNPGERQVIFPGAFNPWHDDHERMAQVAHNRTGQPVDLEVCVRNVDKPALNYAELQTRLTMCVSAATNKPWAGYIHLSSTPTFVEKAKRFPNALFVVGWDTLRRIGDPKYGDPLKVAQALQEHNIRFLAFHRKTVADEGEIFGPLRILTTVVPPDEHTPGDLASSTLRRSAQ